MFQGYHTILPVIFAPDGDTVTDEDLATLRSVRLPLIDWWAAYGHGLLIMEPVPLPAGLPLSALVPQPFQTGCKLAFDHYPIVSNPDLTILFAIKGIDSKAIGDSAGWTRTYGMGALQYALVAWDSLEAAKVSEEGRTQLQAICAHELGHAVHGWAHDFVTPWNIMGPWWSYPAVGMPAASQASFKMLSAGAAPSLGGCPVPPLGPS